MWQIFVTDLLYLFRKTPFHINHSMLMFWNTVKDTLMWNKRSFEIFTLCFKINLTRLPIPLTNLFINRIDIHLTASVCSWLLVNFNIFLSINARQYLPISLLYERNEPRHSMYILLNFHSNTNFMVWNQSLIWDTLSIGFGAMEMLLQRW